MKRHIIILLLMGLMPIHLLARTISREEAANFALQFLSDGESEPELAPMLLNTDEEDLFSQEGHEYMYLVQTIDDGWVVMSTDDRFPPVLAKGDGIFYPFHDSIPPAMRELLNEYIREMKYIEDRIDYAGTHIEWIFAESINEEAKSAYYENGNGSDLYTPGSFLLRRYYNSQWQEVNWGQSGTADINPCLGYNKFCPNDFNDSTKKSLVGCTAVAMAQVMWYWEWPHTAFIPTEIDENGNTNDVTNIQLYYWDKMPDRLYCNTSVENLDYVAKLLRDCGYAAHMEYSAEASGASLENARSALINQFAYHENIQVKWRFFTMNWAKKLRAEINAGRPVIYEGWTLDVVHGHAFVIDGYKKENPNMFHVNWGGRNTRSGFFYLNDLKEESHEYAYNHYHKALFCIRPNPTCIPKSVSSDVSTGEIYRMGTGDMITVSNSVIEPNSRTIYFSGTGIRITPGFHAKSGSNVTMQIRYFPCDYVANVSVQAMPRKPEKDVIEHKVEQNDQFFWSVSPNPVISHLRVNADKDIRAIELYSIDGRRYEWKEQKEINVSSLPNGMYLLRVHCMDNEILQTKIIKQ